MCKALPPFTAKVILGLRSVRYKPRVKCCPEYNHRLRAVSQDGLPMRHLRAVALRWPYVHDAGFPTSRTRTGRIPAPDPDRQTDFLRGGGSDVRDSGVRLVQFGVS